MQSQGCLEANVPFAFNFQVSQYPSNQVIGNQHVPNWNIDRSQLNGPAIAKSLLPPLPTSSLHDGMEINSANWIKNAYNPPSPPDGPHETSKDFKLQNKGKFPMFYDERSCTVTVDDCKSFYWRYYRYQDAKKRRKEKGKRKKKQFVDKNKLHKKISPSSISKNCSSISPDLNNNSTKSAISLISENTNKKTPRKSLDSTEKLPKRKDRPKSCPSKISKLKQKSASQTKKCKKVQKMTEKNKTCAAKKGLAKRSQKLSKEPICSSG